jgi:phosphatidylcholine synthase
VAWLAHLYTAGGAVFAFLAAVDVFERDYRTAFFWLFLQIAVDATDGFLARALDVKRRTPHFDGAKLDDIVDYLCYVFVPALIVWRAPLVPDDLTIPVAAAVLLSSAYGFNRLDAKTADHYFLGFPSYWNLLVFYLLIGQLPPAVNAVILLALAALVFVPIRFLYPTRGSVWPRLTNLLGWLWGLTMLGMLWQFPNVAPLLLGLSLVYPVYYTALSLWLEARRRLTPPAGATP